MTTDVTPFCIVVTGFWKRREKDLFRTVLTKSQPGCVGAPPPPEGRPTDLRCHAQLPDEETEAQRRGHSYWGQRRIQTHASLPESTLQMTQDIP